MKQFKIVLLISLIAFSTPSQAQTAKEIAWMEKAKGVVKQMLKDPSTVQFQNVFVSRKAGMPGYIVSEYLTRLVEKGSPIIKKYVNNTPYIKLNPDFKRLQAKENILMIDTAQKELVNF